MSINHLAFNQDTSLITCGTDDGFIIFKLDPSLQKHIFTPKEKGISLMRILNKTNISVLVEVGDDPIKRRTRRAILWDDHTKKESIQVDIADDIYNVLVGFEKIVVVLKETIYMFNFHGYVLKTKPTFRNESGICQMVTHGDTVTLATLGTEKGEVIVWKPDSEETISIKAHSNSIECITLNDDATFVATASEIGTNIHVYNTENGDMVYKFKRGTFSNTIYDLAFSSDMAHLACCSASGTIHIFDLYDDDNDSKNQVSIANSLGDFLPLANSYFKSKWNCQQLDLGTTDRAICAFDKENNLHVAAYNGTYYKIAGDNFEDVIEGKLFIES